MLDPHKSGVTVAWLPGRDFRASPDIRFYARPRLPPSDRPGADPGCAQRHQRLSASASRRSGSPSSRTRSRGRSRLRCKRKWRELAPNTACLSWNIMHGVRSSSCPRPILEDLATSQVSIFAAQTQTGELGSRIEMTAVVNHHHIRHGHMVNINREIMLEGMRADFVKVDELSQRLVERARRAERIRCKTPRGTEFEAELSPKLKWLKTSGIIHEDKWGNLPGGEIFTSPQEHERRLRCRRRGRRLFVRALRRSERRIP